ncbi:carboxypeptidase-like regulatory domain-containing protein [Bremerella sp. JC770]|uniref:carboxypeptidase-like regulatory domain-containing protein n=1 Tax=Bremerella sp. JC770 TaxID=3232137 RepID=UPI0034594C3F
MKLLASSCSLLAMTLLLGCGPSTTEATTGTVTLDGEPLPDAEIIFTPEEGGRPAVAETDSGGNFELIYTVGEKGAPPGKYVVRVQTSNTTYDAEGQEIIIEEKVPPKYNRHSTLVCEVKESGENHFELELKSED